eukprot:gnl/MRDRNA2_/MRDRNA2_31396_c0_seq1.p1 gnl/MRDRNA2_/MRDRNA2_31396_c0~~gnl/MRDRNA2_/MRDRNA2_31396_c0_seq1.p1  ORF type:complete len:505 (+),score=64.86 gnl/MRDRNA2_/MRDRNA2_31396_c0_seq1:82-1596(+)
MYASRHVAMIFLSGHAAALLRQELHNVMLNEHYDSVAYPEQFYTEQRLDHFNASDERTYKQRYFANFDHYKPGGPIFIYIGGEGPLSATAVSGFTSNALFAERLNGATVAVEHRFYGKSQPFDSLATEHLQYLTSQQALHDLAQFQAWFIANRSLDSSHFFCMGGSYPGNLAAWYRLDFPNMTDGCWAASAPVEAKEIWPGFGEMVWKAVATDWRGVRDDSVSVKLYAGYEQIAGLIHDPTPASFQMLMKTFNVCPGTLVSQQDRDNLEMTISTFPGLIMQYNNTKTPKLKAIRDLVIKAETPLDAALSVSRFLNLTVGTGPGGCTDNSIGTFYSQLSNATLPSSGEGNAGRTWTWQTCNEFGYFQTGTSIFEKPTMYTRGASSKALWQQVCEDIFGISSASIGARIAATNRHYGAKQPPAISHVFFSNGDLDAWSLLSVTSYPSNEREVYAQVAALGSHCVGLYSPMPGEIPDAKAVRERAFDLFQKWSQHRAPISTQGVFLI